MRTIACLLMVISAQIAFASEIESVVVVGINDFHGALAPVEGKDGKMTGGAVALAARIREIKMRNPGHVLVLDAGDEWQGTLDSNLEEGAPVVRYYNAIGVDAAAIGNHEFDFGPLGPDEPKGYDPLGAIKVRIKEAKYPYLSANLIDRATGKLPAWSNLKASTMLKAGRLKIGVIGLTTTSTPVTTRGKYVTSLEFGDLERATLRESAELRQKGAHLVLVVAHAGLECGLSHEIPPAEKVPLSWTIESEQPPCQENEEIPRLLSKLPAGTVDAVVAGHTHKITHHWVNGVPVIQSGAHNRFFTEMTLSYDMGTKKLIPSKTVIVGPIAVTPGGQAPAVKRILAETFMRTARLKARVITRLGQAMKHSRTSESELANLVTDAYRWKTKADFALMNPGGIRVEGWLQGPFTYETLFRTLPFENRVALLKVTGNELTEIVRVAHRAEDRMFGTSGLRVEVLPAGIAGKARDVDGNGKFEDWEIDRLVKVTTRDGKALEPAKLYTLATIDFLVEGGDGMGWPMGRVSKDRVELEAAGYMREVVEEYLATRKEWNTPKTPVLDPSNPRLVIQVP